MLIINSANSYWGAEVSLLTLLNKIKPNKYKLVIRNEHGNLDSLLIENNIEFEKLDIELSPFKLNFIVSVFRIIKMVLKNKIRIIYCNNDDLSSLIAVVKLLLLFNIKTYVHIRNLPGKIDYYKKLMFIHSNIICNSLFTKTQMTQNLKYVRRNISIVPNAHGQKAINKILESKFNREYLLTVGRIDKNKSQLDVIKILNDGVFLSKINYFIVGGRNNIDNKYNEKIEKYIYKNGIEKFIHIYDFTHEIGSFYKNAFATIVPSHVETFGRVVIESGYWGTPVIVRNIDSLCEIICHNETGLIWDGSPEQLLFHIKNLQQNRVFRNYLGNNLKQKVKNHYSDKSYIKNLQSIVGF